MRFIHTADWHLGQLLHGFDRAVEHDEFLDWLRRTLAEQRVDALLVAGDVYDVVNPPVSAQQRLFRFLRRVLEDNPGLQVVLIGGNHDSPARLELPRDLVDPERVFLVGSLPKANGEPDYRAVTLKLNDGKGASPVVCVAIPYLRPADLPVIEGSGFALHRVYDDAVRAAREMHPHLPMIVTGHLNVVGGEIASASERRIVVGGEEACSASIFGADVAYVALGHLHRPQEIPGTTKIRYAGAPFPLSVSEHQYVHSVTLGEINDDREFTQTILPIPRPVEFIRVPASGAIPLKQAEADLERLDVIADDQHRAYLEVVVSLDGPEPGLRKKIEAAIGSKPVRLVRLVSVAREIEGGGAGPALVATDLNELAPARVFTLLHRRRFENDPDAELTRAFEELLAIVEVAAGSTEVDA